jgi:hypothetical protein
VLGAGRRLDTTAVGREAEAFFGVGPDLALDEIATVADRFRTFRVVPDQTRVALTDEDIRRGPGYWWATGLFIRHPARRDARAEARRRHGLGPAAV